MGCAYTYTVKVDLHCHSYFSDGKHTPEFLLQRATENGISHLAITDHDSVDCYASELIPETTVTLIPGVEISCQWGNREIHVVGLGIDPDSDELNRLLTEQQAKRRTRVVRMNERAEKHNINGLLEFMTALPAKSWTRSHVAEFLITNGHCKNWEKAFKNFLSRRGKIFASIDWANMDTVVATIEAAGGISVLAHPGRYSLSQRKLAELVSDFKNAGGEALEGSYGNIDPVTRKKLCQMAAEYQLYVSIGSDFHDASRHWTDLGKMPNLDSETIKNAIWEHPKWHF